MSIVTAPLKYLGRFVGYGTLMLALAGPPIYQIGYKRGELNATLKAVQSSDLEKVADDQYKIKDPESRKDFIVNFADKTLKRASRQEMNKINDKSLDKLF